MASICFRIEWQLLKIDVYYYTQAASKEGMEYGNQDCIEVLSIVDEEQEEEWGKNGTEAEKESETY